MKEYVDRYLKLCNVSTIDELSNEQVLRFLLDEHLDKPSKWYAFSAQAALKDGSLTEESIVQSIKKSMKIGKRFRCCYIENESANGEYFPRKSGWILEP